MNNGCSSTNQHHMYLHHPSSHVFRTTQEKWSLCIDLQCKDLELHWLYLVLRVCSHKFVNKSNFLEDVKIYLKYVVYTAAEHSVSEESVHYKFIYVRRNLTISSVSSPRDIISLYDSKHTITSPFILNETFKYIFQ